MTLTWWRRKQFLEKKVAAQNPDPSPDPSPDPDPRPDPDPDPEPTPNQVAAQNTQHRIRTIRARREYQKWSKERQARSLVTTPSKERRARYLRNALLSTLALAPTLAPAPTLTRRG